MNKWHGALWSSDGCEAQSINPPQRVSHWYFRLVFSGKDYFFFIDSQNGLG